MAITAFTACSDDDDYQPAQKVAEDNMGAYFAAANAASEVLTPEEYAARPTVDLKVKRQNTKGDVSIPVVVDKADAVFKVPEVTFEWFDDVKKLYKIEKLYVSDNAAIVMRATMKVANP